MRFLWFVVVFFVLLVTSLLAQQPILPLKQCSEEVKKEYISSDGKYVAVLFEQNCGATNGYGLHVNLRLASSKLTPTKDGSIEEGQVFVSRGQPTITISWVTNTILWIDCQDCQGYNIFQKDFNWKGIDIVYQKPDVKAFAARDAQIAATVNSQDKAAIKVLSEKIMSAGVNNNIGSIYSLVSQGSQGKEAIQKLTTLFQKRNLFDGYKYIDFEPPGNMYYTNPTKTICQAIGIISYSKGSQNVLVVTFVKENNEWKLDSVQKIGPPFTK